MRVSTGKVRLKKSNTGLMSFTVPKLVAADLGKYVGIDYACIVQNGSVLFQPLSEPRTFRLNIK